MPQLTHVERLRLAWFLWWPILLESFFVNLAVDGFHVEIDRDCSVIYRQ